MSDQPAYRPGAGASARARYEALAAPGRRRRRIVAAVSAPAAGVAEIALLGDWRLAVAAALAAPAAVLVWQRRHDQHGTWAKGAIGERKTARMLRPLTRRGYVVLHDRALPRGRANVDHIIVGAAGVVVVDSKNWSKQRIVKGKGRRLMVGRMYATNIVKSTVYERDVVRDELERAFGREVPVAAVLAVHGAKLPPWRTLSASGVPILPARQVRRWMTRQDHRLSPADVERLVLVVERSFPPYQHE